MVTPDPRRGDEPDLQHSEPSEINGSAPQPDDMQHDDDAAPAGQYGPTADYGDEDGDSNGVG